MALYINEQCSSIADFVSKLYTFLTTGGAGNPGWNADRHVPGSGEMAVSKAAQGTNTNDIQVAFQWDTSAPSYIGIYQYNHASGAGNYNTGAAPYAQSNDSGNGGAGSTNATLSTSRYISLSDSTIVQYWAFVETTGVEAVHVVVQTGPTTFAHMGFGEVIKFNDWTGGAYAYGTRFQTGFNNNQTTQTGSTLTFDGYAVNGGAPNPTSNMDRYCATINASGLPGQGGSEMWGVVMGAQSSLNNDRQSTPQARKLFPGGYRAGMFAKQFGQFIGSPTQGFLPVYPITFWYNDGSGGVYGPMGRLPLVRGILLENFAAGDEITVGSDTFMVFPNYKIGSGSQSSVSLNQGIAIKKN